MNPCRKKGDPKGRQFTLGKNGERFTSPCECAKTRVALYPDEDGRYLRYGMRVDSEHPGETIHLKDPRFPPAGTIRVVPCYETFRRLGSVGTQSYRNISTKTQFLGCERLENTLEAEKLVQHNAPELEDSGWHLLEGTQREPLFSIPGPDAFLDSYAEMAGYAMELVADPEKREIASQLSFESHPSHSPAISDLIRLSPLDINHAQLRRLYARGAFDKNLKLKVTAFFLCRNIKDRDLIEKIMPHFSFEDFNRCRKKIEQLITRSLPEKLRRLQKVWNDFSAKQRMAVRLKYDEGLSLEEAAQRLHISVDSFRDRLKGAERKLELAFPELTKVVESEKRKQNPILPVSHWNRSGGMRVKVKILDRKAVPWGPPKWRKNVNRNEVQRWLDRVCPRI